MLWSSLLLGSRSLAIACTQAVRIHSSGVQSCKAHARQQQSAAVMCDLMVLSAVDAGGRRSVLVRAAPALGLDETIGPLSGGPMAIPCRSRACGVADSQAGRAAAAHGSISRRCLGGFRVGDSLASG